MTEEPASGKQSDGSRRWQIKAWMKGEKRGRGMIGRGIIQEKIFSPFLCPTFLCPMPRCMAAREVLQFRLLAF
jgi:hypothetical protein